LPQPRIQNTGCSASQSTQMAAHAISKAVSKGIEGGADAEVARRTRTDERADEVPLAPGAARLPALDTLRFSITNTPLIHKAIPTAVLNMQRVQMTTLAPDPRLEQVSLLFRIQKKIGYHRVFALVGAVLDALAVPRCLLQLPK
jgi:hypothetical protein